MTDAPEPRGGAITATAWIVAASLGLVMTAGAIAGFIGAHQEGGDGMSALAIAILAGFFAIACALAYSIWRNVRHIRLSNETLNRRERQSNRVIIACGVIGALLAVSLTIGSELGGGAPDIFSSAPIDPVFAIGLALVIGLLMPLISWYWHNRVIDELEAHAYRSGALIAIYAYWTISPTWWVLWRGGLVPAPDGIAIYMITIFTALFIWFWQKFR